MAIGLPAANSLERESAPNRLAPDRRRHRRGRGVAVEVEDEGSPVDAGTTPMEMRRGAVLGLEIVGESHALALGLGLAQGLEFFAALGDQLVLVLRGGGQCRTLPR